MSLGLPQPMGSQPWRCRDLWGTAAPCDRRAPRDRDKPWAGKRGADTIHGTIVSHGIERSHGIADARKNPWGSLYPIGSPKPMALAHRNTNPNTPLCRSSAEAAPKWSARQRRTRAWCRNSTASCRLKRAAPPVKPKAPRRRPHAWRLQCGPPSVSASVSLNPAGKASGVRLLSRKPAPS